MAHMIDVSTGKPAIAYVGATPWHGLGSKLTPGADIETWRTEAGLDYDVARAAVQYDRIKFNEIGTSDEITIPSELTTMPGRDVLYRTDTGAALSVVSKDYKIVQPGEVLDFFAKLAEIGGFDLETAGALSDGKRIWALAKVNEGAPVIGHDVVRPYVLLATSYDGTLATTAKMTTIRVVCNNTLTMSVGSGAETGFAAGKAESDTEGRAVSSLVRIPHSKNFDAEKVRLELGIVANVFERWLVEARILSERAMDEREAGNFVAALMDPLQPKVREGKPLPSVRETKGYQRIMDLFSGGNLIGEELTGGDNRWKMLNACTQFIDHERGRSANSRLSQAWFGTGEAIKSRAYQMLKSDRQFDDVIAA